MAIQYTPNTPNATDPMNVTQPLILNNFGAINELIAVNHVGFNKNGFGNHNFLTMPTGAVPPSPQSLNPNSTDINLFVNAGQIYGQYPAGATFPITGNNSGSSGTSGVGWCKFPSGIIMKWGIGTTVNAFITFPTGPSIPVFTQYPTYFKITPLASAPNAYGNIGVEAGNYGNGQFRVFGVAVNGAQVNWFAIGK